MAVLASIIIRILLVILAFWLIRRFLGVFVGYRKPAASNKTADAGKNMVKDPVCGMYMDPRLAVKYKINNGIFYFCSEKCKNDFLNTPPHNPQPEK